MTSAGHHSMMGGMGGIVPRPLYRYMKLVVPEVRGIDVVDRKEYVVQASKLDIIDSSEQYFSYPSATGYTLSRVYRENYNEDPLKLLRHSVSYKWCSLISAYQSPPKNFPVTIIFDFKSAVLDTNVFNRWWIYTSNDTDMYPNRNPSIDLYFSADGVSYDLADSVTYNDFPAASKTRAFIRPLFRI